jgi:hypothetical protein
MLNQMKRWNQLNHAVDERLVAARCVDSGAYRRAAEALSIPCPEDDFPPLPLRSGMFDPRPIINQSELQGAVR